MAVAPLLAGWWLRQGAQLPAPTRNGTNHDTLNDGTQLMVEMLVDGLWENLTSLGYVKADNRVSLSRGQSSEGSVSDAGRCSFSLKNHVDLGCPFSEGNPESPYYGKFAQGALIRVSVPSGNAKSIRFQGEITELEEDWDVSGKDGWVTVQAAGVLNRLGQNDQPLHSAFRRMTTSTDPAGSRVQPQAYWPMEDESDADFCAPAAGDEPMTFTGSPSLGSYSGFDCSKPIPNVSGSAFAGYVPGYTIDTSKASAWTAWWLMSAAAALTVGTLLVRVVTLTHRWEIVYVSAGNLRLRIYDFVGTIIYDSGSVAVAVVEKNRMYTLSQLDDGANLIAHLSSEEVGTDIIDGLIDAPVAIADSKVQYVQVNPNATATDFYVGHLAVFNHAQNDISVGSAYTSNPFSLAAYGSERADTRFARLCTEEGITHEVLDALTDHPLGQGLKVGVGQKMGAQAPKSLIDLLRECEATDGGMIYEMVSDFGLGYRTLKTMTSQSAAVTLSHGNHELAEQPKARRDNAHIQNDVTVTNQGGSSAQVVDTTSPMSVNPFPAGVGHYPASATLSLWRDADTIHQAAWRLHLGTVSAPRYQRLAMELASNELASTALRQAILAVRQGDRVDITDTPARLSFDDIVQLAMGYSETIDKFTHRLAWNTVPEAPYRIAMLDTAGYDRMDAEDSRVADDITATATTILVNSLDGTRWIDSANYSSRFPFDINIGGERMTVTAITGVTQDAFTRSASDSWGNADVGGAWSTQGGASTDFDVNGSAGTVTLTTVNVSRRTVLQTNRADIDQYIDISTDQLATGDSQAAALFGRSQDTNNKYMARLEFTTAQVIRLTLRKRVLGVETALATYVTPYTHAVNTPIRLRFKIEGSLLQAKAYLASADEEPAGWDLTVTDTDLDNARDVGTRSILFTGNTNVNPVISYDNYMGVAGQWFTVTRSVNGVVKAHLVQSQVHIWDIVYIGL